MNTTTRVSLLTATLAGLLAASPAFAATSLTRPDALKAPLPVSVVPPTGMPACYENSQIRVAFTLDQTGTPHHVVPVGAMPADLAARVIPAVSQWRFTPCTDRNGKAVPREVILPLLLK